jgi:hypothetical protein
VKSHDGAIRASRRILSLCRSLLAIAKVQRTALCSALSASMDDSFAKAEKEGPPSGLA